MKRIFCALALVMGCIVLMASSTYAVEVTFDNYMAGARYKENDTAGSTRIGSYWTGFLFKGMLAAADYDNKNIEGELRYGMSLTPKQQEKWNVNDVEYQTNDMSFWGIDTGLALGWAVPITFAEDKQLTITPLVGYTWRFTRFTRSNFVVLRTITIAETVDEDYNVHTLDLGGRFSFQFKDNTKFDFYAKPMFGIVLYDSANNSRLGMIKGDGGFIFTIDMGVDYAFTKNWILGLLARIEYQSLEGGTKNNIIWPDNTFEVYGGTVSLKYRF